MPRERLASQVSVRSNRSRSQTIGDNKTSPRARSQTNDKLAVSAVDSRSLKSAQSHLSINQIQPSVSREIVGMCNALSNLLFSRVLSYLGNQFQSVER